MRRPIMYWGRASFASRTRSSNGSLPSGSTCHISRLKKPRRAASSCCTRCSRVVRAHALWGAAVPTLAGRPRSVPLQPPRLRRRRIPPTSDTIARSDRWCVLRSKLVADLQHGLDFLVLASSGEGLDLLLEDQRPAVGDAARRLLAAVAEPQAVSVEVRQRA